MRNTKKKQILYSSGINSLEKNKGGYEWTLKDGKTVRLIVEVE